MSNSPLPKFSLDAFRDDASRTKSGKRAALPPKAAKEKAHKEVDEAVAKNSYIHKAEANAYSARMTTAGIVEPVVRLRADVKRDLFSDDIMTREEIRQLVSTFYEQQDNRIRAAGRQRELAAVERQHSAITYATNQASLLETNIQAMLQVAVEQSGEMGEWLMSLHGIGPVLAAGILAHINMEIVQVAGQIHSYAGMTPGKTREKGKKLTYNPELKKMFWKVGQSFVRANNPEVNTYRRIYDERKLYEQAKNLAGDYKSQADDILAAKKIEAADYKATLEKGMLSDGHIDARCKRYAVKMFISHYFELAYFSLHQELPVRPFVIEHLGHIDYVRPPNSSIVKGFDEALLADNRPKIPLTYRKM